MGGGLERGEAVTENSHSPETISLSVVIKSTFALEGQLPQILAKVQGN